jgi:hypothetical protein
MTDQQWQQVIDRTLRVTRQFIDVQWTADDINRTLILAYESVRDGDKD